MSILSISDDENEGTWGCEGANSEENGPGCDSNMGSMGGDGEEEMGMKGDEPIEMEGDEPMEIETDGLMNTEEDKEIKGEGEEESFEDELKDAVKSTEEV